jgi:hypothetical protein
MSLLVAISFCSTLSMALSRARPIKNSRERSGFISWVRPLMYPSDILTVNALLVSEGLALLRLVPVQDQAVSEGQGRSSVGGGFIAVEEGARKSGLDMANSVFRKVVCRREGLGHLLEWSVISPLGDALSQLTYKLPPCLALRLWNTRFNALDVTGTETRYCPLVLRTDEGRTNGTLQVSKWCACRGLALPR